MQKKSATVFACILTIGLGASALATDIPLADVPADIRDVAESYAPGTTFTAAGIERESGRTIYELSGAMQNGRRIEIDVFENGELDEIEMEAGVADLPRAVKETLDRAAPGADIVFVETSVHGDGRFYYEVEVRSAGVVRSFEIAEDGGVVSVEGGADS